ncbi:MAG: DNA polymerase III, partial [Acidobacteria bacterium]
MDNKAIAGLLYETADLLEIDGQDPFRIRSYRRAAEAVEAMDQQVTQLIAEPKKLLEVPGIGRGMLANLQRLSLHAELIGKYRPTMLELLKIQGLGPKTIALIWSAYQVADVEGVEKLAREGKIRILPRMGEKHEQKLLKSIEDYRRIAGRYLLDSAEIQADKLVAHLAKFDGIDRVTPAGSLRRGRETVGDLDVLVTGKCCVDDQQREELLEHIIKLPGLMEVIAKGGNKVSFRLRSGMQVDVRTLAPDSFGAAMQYFTGSKSHNVALRQRALKMG